MPQGGRNSGRVVARMRIGACAPRSASAHQVERGRGRPVQVLEGEHDRLGARAGDGPGNDRPSCRRISSGASSAARPGGRGMSTSGARRGAYSAGSRPTSLSVPSRADRRFSAGTSAPPKTVQGIEPPQSNRWLWCKLPCAFGRFLRHSCRRRRHLLPGLRRRGCGRPRLRLQRRRRDKAAQRRRERHGGHDRGLTRPGLCRGSARSPATPTPKAGRIRFVIALAGDDGEMRFRLLQEIESEL
jgi:hypothetical protein